MLAFLQVTQYVHVVEDREKMRKLYAIIDGAQKAKILIFAGTKRDVDTLCRSLNQDRYQAMAIHGMRLFAD